MEVSGRGFGGSSISRRDFRDKDGPPDRIGGALLALWPLGARRIPNELLDVDLHAVVGMPEGDVAKPIITHADRALQGVLSRQRLQLHAYRIVWADGFDDEHAAIIAPT